jgi:hypothetical protein
MIIISQKTIIIDFYFVDRIHDSGLHGDLRTPGCEAHMIFADESTCLTVENVRNEGIFLISFTDERRR